MGSEGGRKGGHNYLLLDPTTFTEENCVVLCAEMPRCAGFTFRADAEKDSLAGLCLFKDKITKIFPEENRNTYLKPLAPPPATEDEEPADYDSTDAMKRFM